jgi:hypothetical protein
VASWQHVVPSHVSPAAQPHVTVPPQLLLIFPHTDPAAGVGHPVGAQHAPALQSSPAAQVLQVMFPPHPFENVPHAAPPMLTVAHVSGVQHASLFSQTAGALHSLQRYVFAGSHVSASSLHWPDATDVQTLFGAQQLPMTPLAGGGPGLFVVLSTHSPPLGQMALMLLSPQPVGRLVPHSPAAVYVAAVFGTQQVPAVPLVVEEQVSPAAHGQLTEVPPQPSSRLVPHSFA